MLSAAMNCSGSSVYKRIRLPVRLLEHPGTARWDMHQRRSTKTGQLRLQNLRPQVSWRQKAPVNSCIHGHLCHSPALGIPPPYSVTVPEGAPRRLTRRGSRRGYQAEMGRTGRRTRLRWLRAGHRQARTSALPGG